LQFSSKAEILRRSFVFSSLNNDELGELANLAIERSFVSNEFIFWDGGALLHRIDFYGKTSNIISQQRYPSQGGNYRDSGGPEVLNPR